MMASDNVVTIKMDTEAMNAMNNLAAALDRNGVIADQRMLNILRDVWFQFSIDRRVQFHEEKPGRWAGGLSVLEDVEHELRAARIIDEKGLEIEA